MITVMGDRLLNTIRKGDYYLLTEDFDSCEWWLSLSLRLRRELIAMGIDRYRGIEDGGRGVC
jgi:hypothetical protein